MLIFLLPFLVSADIVTLELKQGLIFGEINEKVEIYKGVPFAEPPTGDLRKCLENQNATFDQNFV